VDDVVGRQTWGKWCTDLYWTMLEKVCATAWVS
jgi:hypothetical protein